MAEERDLNRRIREQRKDQRRDDELRRVWALEPVVDIDLWTHITGSNWNGRVTVYEIRITEKDDAQDRWLFVVKGIDEEGTPVVGFHGAGDIVGGMASLARRLQHGNVKWRRDDWYGHRGTPRGD